MMMNDIFADLIVTGKVFIYLDDIMITTNGDMEEHQCIIEEVLWQMEKRHLYTKPSKCNFKVTWVELLGVILMPGKLKMDLVKVQGIVEWPMPKKLKDSQSFMGFCNFYWCFTKDFSTIACPLDQLTVKGTPFVWGPEQEKVFNAMKEAITLYLVLQQPNPNRPYQIECDTLNFATRAVLSQVMEDDREWHPVAFLSASMTKTKWNYEIYNKELMAVILTFKAWHHLLEGTEHLVEVVSDHQNLEYWNMVWALTRWQAR